MLPTVNATNVTGRQFEFPMAHFQYIEFLFLLLLIPVLIGLYFYVVAKKKATARKIGDPALVQQLTAGYSASSFLAKFVLVSVGFGLLVLGLANLRSAASEQKISRNGIDVMLVLDVSKSMLAQDIKPSRLERAKQVMSRLVDKLSDDRIGIVIFAGKAYLQMPLTADLPAAKMYLSSANPESVPTQGTVIGDALRTANASFNAKEKKYKAVILISDGEDHDEAAEKVAEQMAASGVIIHTIGIGSPAGAPLVEETTGEFKKDNEGNTVISRLNEASLQRIAAKTSGQYYLFDNTETVVSGISSQLAAMDDRSIKDDSLVNYESFFQYFLSGAFIFLLLELFISERKRKRAGRLGAKKMAIAALATICFQPAFAQPELELIRQGNESFRKNEFAKARETYTAAVNKNPLSPVARYNLGNSLYKNGNKEEAQIAYDNALKHFTDPTRKSNTLYNQGVIYQLDNHLNDCIAAYKNALKLDPTNEDARQNLQKALEQLRKQEQKQQKPQQQKQQQKKQEPKPQPSKLTKEDADNKLRALSQQEKNLQDKLHKVNAVSVNKPEKDW